MPYVGPMATEGATPGPTPDEVRARVRAVFNAAAAHFDDEPLSFWNHFGRRTVELAGIEAGERVLDACCGSGSSALVMAGKVGPAGRVVGVDLAERLLGLARSKAERQGLGNVKFVAGDVTRLALPDNDFDAVVCVFGIFFAPDMVEAVVELWRVVRPGGSLSITTWGRRVFEPTNAIFWDAVAHERPDLRVVNRPYARIALEPGLRQLFVDAGLPDPKVVHETHVHPVSADTFWTMVLGSGYRGAIDAMSEGSAVRVRAAITARLTAEGITEASADVMYARAVKPL